MYFPRPVGQLASDTLCRFTKSSLTQIQPDSHSCMHARSTRIDSGWLAAKFSARLPPAACVLESDRSKAVSDSYKIYFSHFSQFCDHRYTPPNSDVVTSHQLNEVLNRCPHRRCNLCSKSDLLSGANIFKSSNPTVLHTTRSSVVNSFVSWMRHNRPDVHSLGIPWKPFNRATNFRNVGGLTGLVNRSDRLSCVGTRRTSTVPCRTACLM